jgi:cell division protease FtsH
VSESVDDGALKALAPRGVWVRVPPRARTGVRRSVAWGDSNGYRGAGLNEDTASFAEAFRRFMDTMTREAVSELASPIRTLIDDHLGVDSTQIPVVAASFAVYDHVNLQIAMSAFCARPGRTHRLVGMTGQSRHHGSLSDLLQTAHMMGVHVGAPDLVTLPTGPETSLQCVQFGLFLIQSEQARLIVMMRGADEDYGQGSVLLEMLASTPDGASEALAEIQALIDEHNVFGRQVISFGPAGMGRRGIGMLEFMSRPDMGRDELVLRAPTLQAIEDHVLGIAKVGERLRSSQQHVKRGLLLYGPPGTGKTHTLRYLMALAQDHTILILTGGALGMVRMAAGVGRALQPCIVILEDVDLVAQERDARPGYGNPILFELLNVMDGIEEDADVAFVLTTNRADLLEPALAARPGRVDLAVEIPLPDAEARRRLVQLYGRGLDLRLDVIDAVIERTSGVTASFIKELMRKAALAAALAVDGDGPIPVTDRHVSTALDELLDEESALTRSLLGGRTAGDAALEATQPE